MTKAGSASVAQRLSEDKLFFDSAIVSHGFAPFLRDYDVTIDVPAARPNHTGSYIKGRYRYRFTHCLEALASTVLRGEDWQRSWDDVLTDYQAWESAGCPEGFVWGVNWAPAYPGMSYIDDSARARRWSEQVAHDMHEVGIVSNALELILVFHDFRVDQLAAGDPDTGTLRFLDAEHP